MCHQVGQNHSSNANNIPVLNTERAVSLASYGSILDALQSVPYSFGFFPYYEVVQTRTLGVGSLINPAGNVVHPSKATIISATSDFINDADVPFDLILG